MSEKGFLDVRVDITDAEVVEKLDILRLERGISSNSFIKQAIVEQLRREGYLQNGMRKHRRKECARQTTGIDALRNSLIRIQMRKIK